MSDNTNVEPEHILFKSTFTIPVDLTDHDDETGAEIVRKIFVVYQYDQDMQDDFRDGKQEEKDNPAYEQWKNAHTAFGIGVGPEPGEEPPTKITARRDFTEEEQLRKLVVGFKGVPEVTEEKWRKMPPKHKAQILKAILEDIFPNLKSSGA